MAGRRDRDAPSQGRRRVRRPDHDVAAVRAAAAEGVRQREPGELQELVHALRRRVLAGAQADRQPRDRPWRRMGGRPAGQEHLRRSSLLVSLCRRPNRPFVLAQDFYWYNPARLPSPAQWVTIERVRAKDSVNYVWWLSQDAAPEGGQPPRAARVHRLDEEADRERHLQPRPAAVWARCPRGLHRGPRRRDPAEPARDLEHRQRQGLPGQLPQARGLRPHPARFPAELPEFFINFLTEPAIS